MNDKTYDEGLREGIVQCEIHALKAITTDHTKELAEIQASLKTLEKIAYSVVAVVGFVGIFPSIKAMFA